MHPVYEKPEEKKEENPVEMDGETVENEESMEETQ